MVKLREPFSQKVQLHIKEDLLRQLWDKYVPATESAYGQIKLIYLKNGQEEPGGQPQQVQLLLQLLIKNKRMQLTLSQRSQVMGAAPRQLVRSLQRVERYYSTQLKSADRTMYQTVKQYFSLLEQAQEGCRRYQDWQGQYQAIERQKDEYRLLTLFTEKLRERFTDTFMPQTLRAAEREFVQNLTETQYQTLAEELIWQEKPWLTAHLKECSKDQCKEIVKRLEKDSSMKHILSSIQKQSAKKKLIAAAYKLGKEEFSLFYWQVTALPDVPVQGVPWKKSRVEMLDGFDALRIEDLQKIWTQIHEVRFGQESEVMRKLYQRIQGELERDSLQSQIAAVLDEIGLKENDLERIAGIANLDLVIKQLLQDTGGADRVDFPAKDTEGQEQPALQSGADRVLAYLVHEQEIRREQIRQQDAQVVEIYRSAYDSGRISGRLYQGWQSGDLIGKESEQNGSDELEKTPLQAKDRAFAEKLLAVGDREFAHRLLWTEDREFAEQLLMVGDRTFAEKLLQIGDQKFAGQLLRMEDHEFAERLLQVEDREFARQLLQMENREFAEQLLQMGDREFAGRLLQMENHEFAEKLMQDSVGELPDVSYRSLWEWGTTLLYQPAAQQEREDADLLSAPREETFSADGTAQEGDLQTQMIRRQIEMAKDRNRLQGLIRQINHQTEMELSYTDAQLGLPQVRDLLRYIQQLDERQYGVLVRVLAQIAVVQKRAYEEVQTAADWTQTEQQIQDNQRESVRSSIKPLRQEDNLFEDNLFIEKLLAVGNREFAEKLLLLENRTFAEELLAVEDQVFAKKLLAIEDQEFAEKLLRVENQAFVEELLAIEDREFAEKLLHVENQAFAEKLLATENREFAEKLLRVENQVFAEKLLEQEDREFAEKLLRLENGEFVERLLQTQDKAFTEKLMQLFQTENQVFAEKLLRVESRTFAEKLLQMEDRHFARKLLQLEDGEFAEELLQIENREPMRKLPDMSYRSLWAWGDVLLNHPGRQEAGSTDDSHEGVRQEEQTQNGTNQRDQNQFQRLIRQISQQADLQLVYTDAQLGQPQVQELLHYIQRLDETQYDVLVRELAQITKIQKQSYGERETAEWQTQSRQLKDKEFVGELLQLENREFVERLLQLEDRELVGELLQLEDRELVEKLSQLEGGAFIEQLLQLEGGTFTGELLQLEDRKLAGKLPAVSYRSLWAWGEALLDHPGRQETFERSGMQQETGSIDDSPGSVQQEEQTQRDKNQLQRLIGQISQQTDLRLVYTDAQLRQPQVQELLHYIQQLDETQYDVLIRELAQITKIQKQSYEEPGTAEWQTQSRRLKDKEFAGKLPDMSYRSLWAWGEALLNHPGRQETFERSGMQQETGSIDDSYGSAQQEEQAQRDKNQLQRLIRQISQQTDLQLVYTDTQLRQPQVQELLRYIQQLDEKQYSVLTKELAQITKIQKLSYEEPAVAGTHLIKERHLEQRTISYQILAGVIQNYERQRQLELRRNIRELESKIYPQIHSLPMYEAARPVFHQSMQQGKADTAYSQAMQGEADSFYRQTMQRGADPIYNILMQQGEADSAYSLALHEAAEPTYSMLMYGTVEPDFGLAMYEGTRPEHSLSPDLATVREYAQTAAYREPPRENRYDSPELEYSVQDVSTSEDDQQQRVLRMQQEAVQMKSAQQQLDQKLKEVESQLKRVEDSAKAKEDVRTFAEQVKRQLYEELHVEKLRRGLI